LSGCFSTNPPRPIPSIGSHHKKPVIRYVRAH